MRALRGWRSAAHGQNLVEMRPGERVDTWLLNDRVHRPLTAAAGEQLDAVLYVRDYEDGEDDGCAARTLAFRAPG